MPLTHEVDIKIPAVSGSSGRLVVERSSTEEEERSWPGQVFENPELTYEEAMLDFAAARDALVQAAADRARSGEGPTLINAVTYRWEGHTMSEPQSYRTREEVEAWKRRDPIVRFEKELLERGVLTEEKARQIEQEAHRETYTSEHDWLSRTQRSEDASQGRGRTCFHEQPRHRRCRPTAGR